MNAIRKKITNYVSKFVHKTKFNNIPSNVVELAKKNKEVVAIKLHVHTNNISAIKAYEKAGMKKTPEYPYIFNLK